MLYRCILPFMTCGTHANSDESQWTSSRKLKAMKRRMLHISLTERKTNIWVRNPTQVTDIVQHATKLKEQFAGHVVTVAYGTTSY